MKPAVIDANILLRFLLADHPEQSPRCRQLLQQVQEGNLEIFLPEAALSDVVWALKSFYKWTNDNIHQFVISLLTLNRLSMTNKANVQMAITLFRNHNIDFSDALIAAQMLNEGHEVIYSYDRDFNRISGITRQEPT